MYTLVGKVKGNPLVLRVNLYWVLYNAVMVPAHVTENPVDDWDVCRPEAEVHAYIVSAGEAVDGI